MLSYYGCLKEEKLQKGNEKLDINLKNISCFKFLSLTVFQNTKWSDLIDLRIDVLYFKYSKTSWAIILPQFLRK